jgi:diguanylate cyclase (GGDEF)-like protein
VHRALPAEVGRRSVTVSTTLAVLLVVLCVSAGAIGALAWRDNIRDQAEHEFNRQADAVVGKVHQHLTGLDSLFTLAATTSRTGKPLAPALSTQDTIKKYPGVIAIGHAVGSPDGTLRFTDEYSTVSAFGVVDLRMRSMVGPVMRNAVRRATMTGHRTASTRYDVRWFTAETEPSFFLVEPVTAGSTREGWTIALVYGNWMLQDSLQSAGSSFRAEILDHGTVLSRDYLPIGTQATAPPPPISDEANRQISEFTDFGRPLELVVADAEGITRPHIGDQPTMLFVGLSLIGLLAGLLVGVLGRSRSHALRMVHEATEQLRHQAFHDSLTGLANRALFSDRLETALARRADGDDAGVAILLCDLDDFKTVNDSLGHAAGDELLAEVARRLRSCARTGDTVARLGGDEFAVLLAAPVTEAEARRVAERLLETLQAPVEIAGHPARAGSSIGLALDPGTEPGGAGALLRRADLAMYAAKRAGKGQLAVFGTATESGSGIDTETGTEAGGETDSAGSDGPVNPRLSTDDTVRH